MPHQVELELSDNARAQLDEIKTRGELAGIPTATDAEAIKSSVRLMHWYIETLAQGRSICIRTPGVKILEEIELTF